MTKIEYLPNINCQFCDLNPGDFFTTSKKAFCLKVISSTGRDGETNTIYVRTGKQAFLIPTEMVTKHQSVRIEVC